MTYYHETQEHLPASTYALGRDYRVYLTTTFILSALVVLGIIGAFFSTAPIRMGNFLVTESGLFILMSYSLHKAIQACAD